MLYPTGDCTQQGDNPHSPRFRNYSEKIRYVAVQKENLAKYEENNRYNECWRVVTENRNSCVGLGWFQYLSLIQEK